MGIAAKIISGVIGIVSLCGLTAMAVYSETTTEQKVEIIQFETKTKNDNTKREGLKTVAQEGVNGSKTVTYEVKKNIFGRETSRKAVNVKVDKEARDRIIIVGTKKYYICSNGVEYDSVSAKDECEKRVAWEKGRDQALRECNADSSKTNCWYDKYPGTYIHWTNVSRATNGRTGAICRDGWRSSATGRGACSHHGGVAYWI